jgi:phage repressor protein C with HTH and peptisase S24 domain
MSFKKHLERILREKNISRETLAEKLGVKLPNISQYTNGNPTLETLQRMASALDVGVGDLLGEEPPIKPKEGYVYIQELDIEASAGHGVVPGQATIESYFIMKTEDFRLEFNGVDPAKVRVIEVRGDSMAPTFLNHDRVLVNTGDTIPDDGIFVLWIDGHRYIKRVQRIPGKGWKIKSDNKNYEPIELDKNMKVNVEGRVIGAIMVRRT